MIIKKFDDQIIEKVWNMAFRAIGYSADQWRRDICGAYICRTTYGNRQSNYGWEIDHIKPVSAGGTDDLVNLQPLHWKNNDAKGDGKLRCAVR